MAGTRYGLRVAGLRGEDLKKLYTKIISKALLPRNSQRAASHITMSKNQVVDLE
jgi:hypothetical protein